MHNLQKPIVGTLVQGYPPPLPDYKYGCGMRIRHAAENGYCVNPSRSDSMCGDAGGDADTDTANRIATCSDSKRIRTRNARYIQRSDVDIHMGFRLKCRGAGL